MRGWLLLILLTALLRLPAIVHPMALADEGGYAAVAHEVIAGGTLYKDALDRRPPGTFWVYEAIFRAVGPYQWLPFHLVVLGWTLLTLAGLYAIGSSLFSWRVGLAAGLLYTISAARPDWVNLAFNGEVMAHLPIVWALYLAFRPSSSSRRPELAVSGALLACAFLIKQPAAMAAVPVGVYLLLPSYRVRAGLRVRQSLLQAGLLTGSYFATLGVAVALLHQQGILADAWYWTFLDHDVPHGPGDAVFWQRAVKETLATLAAWHPLLLCCGVSVWGRREPGGRYWLGREPERTALLVMFACALVGVSASGRFYAKYYYQLLPALALLGAPALAAILTRARAYRFLPLRRGPLLFLLLGSGAAFLAVNTQQLLQRRTPSPLTQYVREHSSPEDRVFFWGQNDWFYAEAQRRPASRYLLTFPLTGFIFGSPLSLDPDYDTSYRIQPEAWKILEEEFREHPPLFIVDPVPGYEADKYLATNYPYLRRLLAEEYEVVLSIPDGIVYRRRDTGPRFD